LASRRTIAVFPPSCEELPDPINDFCSIRFTGSASLFERYLQLAAASGPRVTHSAGYNYCSGLYEWYTGNPNAALQLFNRAKKDPEWGERAICHMIDICLNPDNEIIGGELAEPIAVNDFGIKPGIDYKYSIMENFILLATKEKNNIEKALNNFTKLANQGTTNVTYLLEKQIPKSKIYLKKIVSQPWNFEDADYLEQCWLLLADVYIAQGKYDLAKDLLKNCLQHNASCSKAYENLGLIAEKELNWPEAVSNYENAWKLSKQRNLTYGYKLAYNYLKCNRYVDAIDICHVILRVYPDYPKIRQEILAKARSYIRI
uniref:TPR_REGION domain-containing protein n=1 Tax=Soboliphyme baturini TaxID=241478 RepID=A0A183IUL4_9BILA